MPLLWPLDSYNTGVITHVLTDPTPTQFISCDSPSLSSPALAETTATRGTESIRVHCAEIDRCDRYVPVKPSTVLLQRSGHGECFALSVIHLSLGRINMLQAAHISQVGPGRG